MHVVSNAGVGDESYGWVDLVAKGKGLRIKQAEKEMWCDKVDMFWQEHAWVDTACMIQLAHKFVRHKIEKHGPDQWVIAFCDNLKAHIDAAVKKLFW